MRGEHLALPEGETTEMPTIEPLVVYRATLRTWLISLAAIPAVVVGVDILWRQRIISWIADLVYESDPESIDLRDEVWAWVLVVVGGAVLVWGLKELFWPAPVLRTDDGGIHVRMNGPFRPPVTLPWLALHDVDAGTLEDDAEEHDVLVIEVKDPELLPENPWAGRRFNDRTVALFTTEWDTTAESIALAIADRAVTIARHANQ